MSHVELPLTASSSNSLSRRFPQAAASEQTSYSLGTPTERVQNDQDNDSGEDKGEDGTTGHVAKRRVRRKGAPWTLKEFLVSNCNNIVKTVVLVVFFAILQWQLTVAISELGVLRAAQQETQNSLDKTNNMLSSQLNAQISLISNISGVVGGLTVRLELLNIDSVESRVSALRADLNTTRNELESMSAAIRVNITDAEDYITDWKTSATNEIDAMERNYVANWTMVQSQIRNVHDEMVANYSLLSTNVSSALDTVSGLFNISTRVDENKDVVTAMNTSILQKVDGVNTSFLGM